MSILEKKCSACSGDMPVLSPEEIIKLKSELHADWQVIENHHIARGYIFPDFMTALNFVNQVAIIAEQEAHHPDISLSWGKVEVVVYTHKVNGLTENDFILAAKIDNV